MSHFAMIRDGAVENVCVWDGQSEFRPDGVELIAVSDLPAGVGIGWTRGADGTWSAPAAHLVSSIAFPQNPSAAPDARAVLASLGFTSEQIETAIKRAGG